MLKLLSLAALATAFVLTTAATSPVSAREMHGMHRAGGYRLHAYRPNRPIQVRPFRPILHPVQPVRPIYHWRHGSHGPVPHWRHGSYYPVHWRHGSRWPHWRYGSAWTYGVPVGVGVATYAAAAPASVCTCLIKEYLEDGSVRFTDTCTKEFAVSPPPAAIQAPAPDSQN